MLRLFLIVTILIHFNQSFAVDNSKIKNQEQLIKNVFQINEYRDRYSIDFNTDFDSMFYIVYYKLQLPVCFNDFYVNVYFDNKTNIKLGFLNRDYIACNVLIPICFDLRNDLMIKVNNVNSILFENEIIEINSLKNYVKDFVVNNYIEEQKNPFRKDLRILFSWLNQTSINAIKEIIYQISMAYYELYKKYSIEFFKKPLIYMSSQEFSVLRKKLPFNLALYNYGSTDPPTFEEEY